MNPVAFVLFDSTVTFPSPRGVQYCQHVFHIWPIRERQEQKSGWMSGVVIYLEHYRNNRNEINTRFSPFRSLKILLSCYNSVFWLKPLSGNDGYMFLLQGTFGLELPCNQVSCQRCQSCQSLKAKDNWAKPIETLNSIL